MISIGVNRELLDKNQCRKEARRLISEGAVKGMSETQLAREIYFHALVFYYCEKSKRFHCLRSHADPIDIDDGGDRRFRRIIYSAFWKIPDLGKRL